MSFPADEMGLSGSFLAANDAHNFDLCKAENHFRSGMTILTEKRIGCFCQNVANIGNKYFQQSILLLGEKRRN